MIKDREYYRTAQRVAQKTRGDAFSREVGLTRKNDAKNRLSLTNDISQRKKE